MSSFISVIIPTLNEADSIKQTLEALKFSAQNVEIIVVDGGSRDETVSIAESFGIKVLRSPRRERGAQMHAGATAASGDVLWFLHADTLPPADAVEKIIEAFADSNVVGGNFTIRFDGDGGAARFLSWLYPNLRSIGLIYGDSAIFVRRDVYETVGGFQPFPIFEDLDFVSRIKPYGKIVNLSASVETSSRRFAGRSFTLVFLRWTLLQILYWLGVSPHALGKFYLPFVNLKKTDN